MTSHPKEPKLPESLEVVAWATTSTKDGKQMLLEPCVTTNAAYMRAHSQWDWKPHAFSIAAHESALKARDAEIERLRGVIVETRRVLEQENNKGDASAIQDTIWRGLAETLFDYLDAAIDQARATGGEKANG